MDQYETLFRKRFAEVYAAALRCFGDEEAAALVAQAAFLQTYREALGTRCTSGGIVV